MNIDKLIEKASKGTITKAEKREVYKRLAFKAGDEYELLLILGRCPVRTADTSIFS